MAPGRTSTADGRKVRPRIFSSVFTMQVEDKDNIRLSPPDQGGGPLYDIEVYCINAARYLFRDEPTEVYAASASSDERRFRQVDETTAAVLRFPGDRLGGFTCSFGAADVSSYRVVGTRGDLRVEPAYEYAQPLRHFLTVDGKTRERTFPRRDQFAPEVVYFSGCVARGEDPEPSGHEGLADVRIVRALLSSARSGKPVTLPRSTRRRRPDLSQEMRKPPVRKPRLVGAEPPSGGS